MTVLTELDRMREAEERLAGEVSTPFGHFVFEGRDTLALVHIADVRLVLEALPLLRAEIERLREVLEKISDGCPAYAGDFTRDATPSHYSNPEDYARERERMSEGAIGDIARAALSPASQPEEG